MLKIPLNHISFYQRIFLGIALIFIFLRFFGRRSHRYYVDGYIQVKDDDGTFHYEHRLVAEAVLARRLAPGEVIHHINGRRDDNRVGNLCVMSDDDHGRYHEWYDWIYKTYGNFPRRETQLDKLRNSFNGIILEELSQ
jgi:hypothetical protein